MAKLPLYDKVKGKIIAYATIDKKHLERAKKHTWVCRTTKKGYTSVYAYVNGKTVTLTIFLFGKPEQGNYIRRNKKGFDYTKANVLQFQDAIAERMEGLITEMHSEDIVIPKEEPDDDCEKLKIGHWIVLFDRQFFGAIKKHMWNISTRYNNSRLYCYVIRSAYINRKNPITINLSRVLLGMQDIETGETLPGMEKMVAVYKRQPTIEGKVIDLRLSNLMRVSRSMMSYRRRAFSNKKTSPFVGVVKYGGRDKWTAVIKGRKDQRPIYLGTYNTAHEAARARDRFIVEQGLHYVVRLNYPLEEYEEILNGSGETKVRRIG